MLGIWDNIWDNELVVGGEQVQAASRQGCALGGNSPSRDLPGLCLIGGGRAARRTLGSSGRLGGLWGLLRLGQAKLLHLRLCVLGQQSESSEPRSQSIGGTTQQLNRYDPSALPSSRRYSLAEQMPSCAVDRSSAVALLKRRGLYSACAVCIALRPYCTPQCQMRSELR